MDISKVEQLSLKDPASIRSKTKNGNTYINSEKTRHFLTFNEDIYNGKLNFSFFGDVTESNNRMRLYFYTGLVTNTLFDNQVLLYVESANINKTLTLWPVFMDEILKATEPLRGDSLLFTTKFPRVPGTQFIDLGRMKD